MDDKELNQVMSVLSAKVPYPVKMYFVEKAMIYKMTLNAYMNILLRQLMRNEDLLNPDKVSQMIDSIEKVDALEQFNEQLRTEVQALNTGVEQKNLKIKELNEYVSDLQERLDNAQANKADVEQHLIGKQRKASQMANKRISQVNEKLSDATQKIKNLEARIAKANKRFKDEDIRDGGGLFQEGKLFQV